MAADLRGIKNGLLTLRGLHPLSHAIRLGRDAIARSWTLDDADAGALSALAQPARPLARRRVGAPGIELGIQTA